MAHITHTSSSSSANSNNTSRNRRITTTATNNNTNKKNKINTMIVTMATTRTTPPPAVAGPALTSSTPATSAAAAAAHMAVVGCDSPNSVSSTTMGSTKVWVKQSAIDAARGIKPSYYNNMNSTSHISSSSSVGGSSVRRGGSNHHLSSNSSFKAASTAFLNAAANSSSNNTTPSRGANNSWQQHQQSSSLSASDSTKHHQHQHLKHIQSCSATTATTSIASSSSSDADDSSASHTLSCQGRRPAWNWVSAVMLEQSRQAIVVRLLDPSAAPPSEQQQSSSNPASSSSSAFARSRGTTPGGAAAALSREVRLPSTALADGSVVLSNDATPCDQQQQAANTNAANTSTSLYEPPSDLITLTHLHEPAVIESLQARFHVDAIYTNTGAVLLALNPFQNVRGMYGEQVMRRYWERAENAHLELKPTTRMSSTTTPAQAAAAKPEELPPHVYAIADEAFRSMMRQLEDVVVVSVKEDDDNKTSLNGTTSLSGTTRGGAVKTSCHQSILVSGESGAGKTVTTKFVMKYLAALSQRSVARQTESATRAYVKVQQQQREQQQQQLQQRQQLQLHSSPVRGGRLSSSASSHQKFQQPAWGVARKDKLTSISSINNNSGGNSVSSRGGAGSNNSDLASLTTMLSSSTTTGSAGSSIESQVLQSNPILESFGNARTVRNDNSSRFGKFIEIQFTGRGQLVGANIETYLLEKVRLVHQSNGERNYHVFYELLSGGMDSRELSQYFIAKTAAPEDFKLTASGTYDRRDGVTDRETYRALRTACSAMKFGIAEIHQIFSVTAALLHASNLNICDEGRHSSSSCEKSYVDTTNVHLTPVCHLLGITQEDLDRAICQHLIQAGRESVVSQCLSRERAEKGLEALLKATYGALFSYLVRRINDSIAYKDASSYSASDSVDLQDQDVMAAHPGGAHSQRLKPVASIGVLDIFGFESFAKNSFEQLCINYCNEALQQQFNAFVLKNEQAEYEREGIEWSFIEFPENQDVLDLIDKRGGGILSVLDDQCRAPGSSDKAFCLDVYKICTGNARFSVDSRQHASLQFSVQHYAGPVEYTTDGFTEKNRDELSKEATDLLKNSRIEFVQELAWIIECSHEMPAEAPGSSSMNNSVAATPSKQFHRADSSVGRATVGGQFRRQLRNLRTKVDQTTPHYIRCLKPNDHLIPDVFDTAVVAEQLRCGGILEAVRVARAGFTQHYPHDDFCRRYRTLAWRELAKKDFGSPGIFASSSSGNLNKSSRSSGFHRNGSFLPSPLPPLGSSGGSVARGKSFRGGSSNKVKATKPEVALSPAEAKAQCKDLVKILYRKIQQQEMDDEQYNDSLRGSSSMHVESPPPIARSFSFQPTPPPTSSRPASSWSTKSRQLVHSYLPPMPSSSSSVGGGTNASVKSRYTAWEKKADPPKQEVAPPNPLWKRGGLSQSDYAKIGIQLGKTKVFLRHKAFETLERMRSREQIKAATMLNAIFRMYLAKSAYLPYRDAFRMEMYDCRQRSGERDDFKESKDQEGDFDDCGSTYRFRQALRLHRTGSFYCQSLVDKWMESKIRNAIHNPVPRHEWGKSAPTSGSFKWVLSEGIWIRNYNI